ncbi:hypothetical protein SMMN14_02575 [Sphaerulina musiva]
MQFKYLAILFTTSATTITQIAASPLPIAAAAAAPLPLPEAAVTKDITTTTNVLRVRDEPNLLDLGLDISIGSNPPPRTFYYYYYQGMWYAFPNEQCLGLLKGLGCALGGLLGSSNGEK